MAIKFFFKPVTQDVGLTLAKMAVKQYIGVGGVKGEAVSFASQYFKDNLTLPVNPESLEISTDSDNKKTNVIKLGQIVIPKGVNLSTLTIESFFPGTPIADILTGHVPSYIVSPLNSIFGKFTAKQYFQYFETLQITQIPTRLVISECGIDMDVLVESIKKRFESADNDLHYTLNLTEYRKTSATRLKVPAKIADALDTAKKVIPQPKPRQKTGLAIGDTVIVSGKYFYDSFGSGPTGTFNNFKGKISHIASNKNATNKYHITTTDGKWRGWVKADQIQGVE